MTWKLAASGWLALEALGAILRAHVTTRAASANGWPLILAAAAAGLAWWAWHAWRHPYGPCWACQGTGRNPGSTRKRFGDCKRCRGTGRQLRVGARLFHKALASRPRR